MHFAKLLLEIEEVVVCIALHAADCESDNTRSVPSQTVSRSAKRGLTVARHDGVVLLIRDHHLGPHLNKETPFSSP